VGVRERPAGVREPWQSERGAPVPAGRAPEASVLRQESTRDQCKGVRVALPESPVEWLECVVRTRCQRKEKIESGIEWWWGRDSHGRLQVVTAGGESPAAQRESVTKAKAQSRASPANVEGMYATIQSFENSVVLNVCRSGKRW